MRSALRFAVMSLLLAAPAFGSVEAQPTAVVQVVEVKGIIDSSVERTVLGVLEEAGADDIVILQIDSAGTLGEDRARRMVDAIRDADAAVVTWVAPPATGQARHGAAVLALAGHVRVMAPGATFGPATTLDLRADAPDPAATADLIASLVPEATTLTEQAVGADDAEDLGIVDHVAPSILDVIEEVDATEVEIGGRSRTLSVDAETATIRFQKIDLWGRLLHAAATPNITYLLLLLAFVGIVFELFHPSTGPAGVSGLAALALGLYGVVTLGGSWLGFGLLVAGIVGFAVDLRFASLGVFTLLGTGGLVSGSLLLFAGPWLRVNPWVLAVGIVGMVLFLLGAMTRVLRDLRAIAAGELEVTDAHAQEVVHENGDGSGS